MPKKTAGGCIRLAMPKNTSTRSILWHSKPMPITKSKPMPITQSKPMPKNTSTRSILGLAGGCIRLAMPKNIRCTMPKNTSTRSILGLACGCPPGLGFYMGFGIGCARDTTPCASSQTPSCYELNIYATN
jgi:hypothetical protein